MALKIIDIKENSLLKSFITKINIIFKLIYWRKTMSINDKYGFAMGNEELFEALSSESYEQLIDRLMKKWLDSLYKKTANSSDLLECERLE